MQKIELSAFLAERSSDTGAAAVESRRNKGARRTARKVAMLDRAEARAKAAGKSFLTSYR